MGAEFRISYGKFVAATWQDPKLVKELKANPASVLRKFGLPVPSNDTKVVIHVVKPTGDGSSESQQAAFAVAKQTKSLDIWIPAPPTAASWSKVNKGVSAAAMRVKSKSSGGNSCCCTPCCCCT